MTRRAIPLSLVVCFVACGAEDVGTTKLVQADAVTALGDVSQTRDGIATEDSKVASDAADSLVDTRDTQADSAVDVGDTTPPEDSVEPVDTTVATDTSEPLDTSVEPDVVVCVPVPETCNGNNDDCDDATDEDTEPECFPYLCAGASGCGQACSVANDCAAGNWCDAGKCVTTGDDGTSCEDDFECVSGHCSNGFCCLDGLCCQHAEDCALLNATACASTSPAGCGGTTTSGFCGADSMCDTVVASTPAVCTNLVCADAQCEAGDSLSERLCQPGGACAAAVVTDCEAYACQGGVCRDHCASANDCAADAKCSESGTCGHLPDGASCASDKSCASEHCANGFCCGSGDCCAQASDCAFMDTTPTCDNASTCSGSKKVGVCDAGHRCDQATEIVPSACQGLRCAAGECVNIEGGGVIEEGLRRHVCSAAGACVAEVEDCRVPNLVSYCAPESDFYGACASCTPRRQACVVFGSPCYCHD